MWTRIVQQTLKQIREQIREKQQDTVNDLINSIFEQIQRWDTLLLAQRQRTRERATTAVLRQLFQEAHASHKAIQESICYNAWEQMVLSLRQRATSPAWQMLKEVYASRKALEKKLEEVQASVPTCTVCYDDVPTIVLLPCGHLSLCDACFADAPPTACYSCRQAVTGSIKAYLP
jgi:hypothetical protein